MPRSCFPPRTPTRLFWLVLVLAASGLRFPGSVAAQDDLFSGQAFSVRILAGFSEGNAVFRPEVWTPFALEVDNQTDRIQRGTFRVHPFADEILEDADSYEVPYAFAPGQRKLIRLVGKFPDWTADLIVNSARRGDQPLASIGVRPLTDQTSWVVVLGQPENTYGIFHLKTQGPSELEEGLVLQHLIHPDLLPDCVQGYDPVSLVVWDGLRMEEPSPEQIQALEDYVEMGGTLVLALGDVGDRLDVPGWRDLLGTLPTSSQPIPIPSGLEQVGQESPLPLLSGHLEFRSSAQVVSDASPPSVEHVLAAVGGFPGEPCLTLDGTPLVYRNERGAGRILVSRLAIGDWPRFGPSLAEIWSNLATHVGVRSPSIQKLAPMYRTYLRLSLLGELPSPLFIGAFLTLYTILVVPVGYLLFHRRKRVEMAWLLLPFWALLFSFIAYHIGALQQHQAIMQRELAIGFMPDRSSLARTHVMSAVYSPTRKLFDLRLDPSRRLLPQSETWGMEDYYSTPEKVKVTFLPDSAGGQYSPAIPPLLIYHWSADTVEFDTLADLGGPIEVSLLRNPGGTSKVLLANRSAYDISHLTYSEMRGVCDLGSLSQGESREVPLEPDSFARGQTPPLNTYLNPYSYYYGNHRSQVRVPLPEFLDQGGRNEIGSLAETQLQSGPRSVFDVYSHTYSGLRSHPFAVAQIDSSVVPIRLGTPPEIREEATLLILPVDLRASDAAVEVGPSAWLMEVDISELGMTLSQGGRSNLFELEPPRDGAGLFSSSAPIQIQNMEPKDASIEFRLRPGYFDPTARLASLECIEATSETDLELYYGSDQGIDLKVSLKWALKNRQTGDWEDLPTKTILQADRLPTYWDETTQNLEMKLDLVLPDEIRKELSGGSRNIYFPLNLPRFNGVFRKTAPNLPATP